MTPPQAHFDLPASSFIGREAELRTLTLLLEQHRLVTVTGPGGMGKTRLALHLVADWRTRIATDDREHAWFVDLSACRSASQVVSAVAAALGANVGSQHGDATSNIGHRLSRLGHILVVLDNVEQVATATAPLLDAWVRGAPTARFLVTSRVALAVDGEQVVPLDPLQHDQAVALFFDRASLVRPASKDAEPAVVSRIVEAIDRMPLNIELAASRMSVLSVSELESRVGSALGVLRSPRQGERHESIQRAVLDSVALLTPPERRLFVLAATLRNGFTLEDAEAILSEQKLGCGSVLEGIHALIRASLLRVHFLPKSFSHYAYFETIREVAEQLLQSAEFQGEREAVIISHARHFASRASEVDVELQRENLLLAHKTLCNRALETGSAPLAVDSLAIAMSLEAHLFARGQARLVSELFAHILEALAPDATDECVVDASVRALLGRGSARRELGESALARTDFEEALQIATRVAEPGLAAVALTKLGELDDVASDTVRARARLDDAMKLLAQTPANDVRKQREAQVLRHLGHAHRREGALAPAVESLSESSMRFRELGCETERTAVLYELAVVQIFASRTREALNLVDEGLEIARRCDTPGMEALLLLARGSALQEMDDLDGAGADYARAAQIFADHGDRHREASALYYLGTTHLEREEPQNALAVLGQARRRIAPVGSPRYEALISAGMAGSHAALQRYGEAKQELRRAEEALSHVSHEPALSAAVAIHRSCLELASGDIAADQRPTAVAEANALVRRNPNDDSRFALRRLLVFASGGRNPEPRALVVRSDGGGFTLPGGNAVALPARSPQRLILLCLATRRVAAPGEVVSTDELIAAGWPDEQILSHAAINRLYVAVTTLRRRGLKDLLLSGGGGYLLSPAVVVRLETN